MYCRCSVSGLFLFSDLFLFTVVGVNVTQSSTELGQQGLLELMFPVHTQADKVSSSESSLFCGFYLEIGRRKQNVN